MALVPKYELNRTIIDGVIREIRWTLLTSLTVMSRLSRLVAQGRARYEGYLRLSIAKVDEGGLLTVRDSELKT